MWFVRDIGFSRAGTLKATLRQLVEQAAAGMFHQELQSIVRLPVHNTLLELVRSHQLSRERIPDTGWLYLSADPTPAQRQLLARQASFSGPPLEQPLPEMLVVEILVELISASRMLSRPSPDTLAKRLASRGVEASCGQILQVFQRYGLEKKRRRSPSLPSLR